VTANSAPEVARLWCRLRRDNFRVTSVHASRLTLQEIRKNIPGYFSCVVAFQTVIYCVLYALGQTSGPRRRLAIRLVLAVCCLHSGWSVLRAAAK
jgi:hypothetical protein